MARGNGRVVTECIKVMSRTNSVTHKNVNHAKTYTFLIDCTVRKGLVILLFIRLA